MTQRHDTDANLEAALHASRTLEDAPEHLIQSAIDVFVARAARPAALTADATTAPRAVGLRQRLSALLSFDSANLIPDAAGVRSTGGGTRQVLFSAEGRDIDLRIGPSAAAGWQLSGQVLGPDDKGSVEMQCGDFHALVDWNDLSEFHFEGVPEGACRLTLRTNDWELELPDVQIPG
jgi:hypothetical protein